MFFRSSNKKIGSIFKKKSVFNLFNLIRFDKQRRESNPVITEILEEKLVKNGKSD